MPAKEVLRRVPVTVAPHCTIQAAASLMGEKGLGSLLVVSGNEVVGIVTDRDVAVRGVGAGQPLTTEVRRVMTEYPMTSRGPADAFQVLELAAIVSPMARELVQPETCS